MLEEQENPDDLHLQMQYRDKRQKIAKEVLNGYVDLLMTEVPFTRQLADLNLMFLGDKVGLRSPYSKEEQDKIVDETLDKVIINLLAPLGRIFTEKFDPEIEGMQFVGTDSGLPTIAGELDIKMMPNEFLDVVGDRLVETLEHILRNAFTVHGISSREQPGDFEVVTLLGPNGIGKGTLQETELQVARNVMDEATELLED